jgi:hypothetical protein
MRTFLFLTIALWSSIGYTGEWISSVPVAPVPPMVITTPVPAVTYVVPQPTVVYGLVPYYYNVPVITERRCWFLRRERQITYQPQVQWYYQPLYYR